MLFKNNLNISLHKLLLICIFFFTISGFLCNLLVQKTPNIVLYKKKLTYSARIKCYTLQHDKFSFVLVLANTLCAACACKLMVKNNIRQDE